MGKDFKNVLEGRKVLPNVKRVLKENIKEGGATGLRMFGVECNRVLEHRRPTPTPGEEVVRDESGPVLFTSYLIGVTVQSNYDLPQPSSRGMTWWYCDRDVHLIS